MRYFSFVAMLAMFVSAFAVRAENAGPTGGTSDVQKENQKKSGTIVRRDAVKEAAGYKTDALDKSLFRDEDVRRFHASNVVDFVAVDGFFGVSRMPYTFRAAFRLKAAEAQTSGDSSDKPKAPPVYYQLASRELIGILFHPSPVAYDAPNIKAMMGEADVKGRMVDAPTRALDPFETKALETLRSGQDLIMTQDSDGVRIVGSIRMSTDCMSCHDGKVGDLLGAFSYRLKDSVHTLTKPAAPADSATQSPGRYRKALKEHGAKILEKLPE